ncbi:hypothetical protein BGZ90_004775 [Linnemannia elongata]|nr:hypothetical protein BGZ90_004775 [Linnemannia elongata]
MTKNVPKNVLGRNVHHVRNLSLLDKKHQKDVELSWDALRGLEHTEKLDPRRPSDWNVIISSNSLVRKLTIAQQCEFLDHKSDENQNDNTEAEGSTPGVKKTLTGNRLSFTNNSVLSSNGGAINGGSKKRQNDETETLQEALELDFGRSTKSQHRLTCILSTLQECAELREFSFYKHAQDTDFKEKMFKNLGAWVPKQGKALKLPFFDVALLEHVKGLPKLSWVIIAKAIYRKKLY